MNQKAARKDGPSPKHELSTWAQYLHGIKGRTGIKIDDLPERLKAIGMPISRATLYRMMRDEGARVTRRRVLAIAEAVGDHADVALEAAGVLLEGAEHQGAFSGQLRDLGLASHDPIVQKILNAPFDEYLKADMLTKLSQKRARQRALQLSQETEDFEQVQRVWLEGKSGR